MLSRLEAIKLLYQCAVIGWDEASQLRSKFGEDEYDDINFIQAIREIGVQDDEIREAIEGIDNEN